MNSQARTIELTSADRKGPMLKVWWIPQVPGKPFSVLLNSFAEAWVLLRTLADYDIFQFENRIKPDYCNAGGLMMHDDDGWSDWTTDDGDDIDDLTLEQACALDRQHYESTLAEATHGL